MTRRNIIILLLKKRKKLTKGKEIKTWLTVKVKYNFFWKRIKIWEKINTLPRFFFALFKTLIQDEDDSRENLAEEVTRGDSESALPEDNHGDTDIEETGEKQEPIVEVDPRNVQVGSN